MGGGGGGLDNFLPLNKGGGGVKRVFNFIQYDGSYGSHKIFISARRQMRA